MCSRGSRVPRRGSQVEHGWHPGHVASWRTMPTLECVEHRGLSSRSWKCIVPPQPATIHGFDTTSFLHSSTGSDVTASSMRRNRSVESDEAIRTVRLCPRAPKDIARVRFVPETHDCPTRWESHLLDDSPMFRWRKHSALH